MATVIKAKFDWNTGDLLAAYGLEPNGRVQTAIDNAVIRHSIPYCPFQTGTLAKSPYSSSSPGKVVYNTPYARYLYYGIVMGPNIPVFDDDSGVPTRFFSPPGQKKTVKKPLQYLQYKTDKSPLAGSFWFWRMKADHSQDILKEAKQVALDK